MGESLKLVQIFIVFRAAFLCFVLNSIVTTFKLLYKPSIVGIIHVAVTLAFLEDMNGMINEVKLSAYYRIYVALKQYAKFLFYKIMNGTSKGNI